MRYDKECPGCYVQKESWLMKIHDRPIADILNEKTGGLFGMVLLLVILGVSLLPYLSLIHK